MANISRNLDNHLHLSMTQVGAIVLPSFFPLFMSHYIIVPQPYHILKGGEDTLTPLEKLYLNFKIFTPQHNKILFCSTQNTEYYLIQSFLNKQSVRALLTTLGFGS